MAAGRGRYVGVGVSSYADAAHQELPQATSDVTDLHALIASDFDGEPLVDPDAAAVQALLNELTDSVADGGNLVVQWSGHAVTATPELGRLRLLTTDSRTNPRAGLAVTELMAACAESGAAQIFVTLDTCFSGAGVATAAEVAARVWDARPPDADRLWVGILSASSADASAYDGVLGARLRQLLTHGPATTKHQLRWSRQAPYITGDDLGGALKGEWDLDVQRPEFLGYGDAMPMFANPCYDAGATPQVVEHLLVAARSTASLEELSAFTGRAQEVNTVIGWVHAGRPGLHVVTGSAGTGKSAIVGRVVSLSVAGERQKLLTQEPELGHDDPGPDSVSAHAHARALTADGVAEILDGWLTYAGQDRTPILPLAGAGRRNAAELAGAIQRRAEHPGRGEDATPPVIVVDGLDEARSEAFTIATDLLIRLARFATVIVSTRNRYRSGDDVSLIDLLAPGGPDIDLDDDAVRERGLADLRAYVTRRLVGVSPAMDGALVGDLVAQRSSDGGDRPFLLARLVADQLREQPVDTGDHDWQAAVSSSIETAFDDDIRRAATRFRAATAMDGDERERVVRQLLVALTWAYGAGFPEDEWIVVASSLTPEHLQVDRDDISWAFDQLGRYILQDGDAGVAVYRLAHASLGEHLRPAYVGTFEEPFDPAATPVTRALLDRYARLLAAGVPADEPGYLWRYALQHAGDLGVPGIDLLRTIAELDPVLRPDIARASLGVAEQLNHWGHRLAAVAPAEEAVALFREQVSTGPAYQSDLARALSDLSVHYGQVGRRQDAIPLIEEALALVRDLARADPVHRSDLAVVLNNLGGSYSDVGRHQDAIPVTEEAVAILRELAQANPAAYAPDLANALNSLGSRYWAVSRGAEAVGLVEESATRFRELARANPGLEPDLAMVLNNLGVYYNGMGRQDEAIQLVEEAVILRREQARINPAYLPDLASALDNLGVYYSEIGRDDEAVPLGEQALSLRREQASTNPAYLPDLASALINLGGRYSTIGREDDAVRLTEEAVALRREQASTNPAYLPDLAVALNNLGNRYSAAGRVDDALLLAEEAVALSLEVAESNPGTHQGDLARALGNLANRYREAGRLQDSVPPREAAVIHSRAEADIRPAHRPMLAGALDDLGACYSDAGRFEDAIAPSEEAVALHRELAEINPAHRFHLATSLRNLSISYTDVGQRDDAILVAEEAVGIHRELASTDPNRRDHMGRALGTLAIAYTDAGRPQDAVAVTEEATGRYRELARADPAYLSHLTEVLNLLSGEYRDLGRTDDAIALAQEAVDTIREPAATSPDHQRPLATALTNLDRWCDEVSARERAEHAWATALNGMPSDAVSYLLRRRAEEQPADLDRAPGWLRQALELAGEEDPASINAIHREARRHRELDPVRFDTAWTGGVGAPPAWLTVDPDLVRSFDAWTSTPTFDDERAHLASHPELLEPAAELAAREALLGTDAEETQRYLGLLAAARADGVDAAYRLLLLQVLATDFSRADPARQRELLAERGDDLLSDDLIEMVDAWAADDGSSDIQRAASLLYLARVSAAGPVLDALADPDTMAGLLQQRACSDEAGATLSATAVVAWSQAETEPQLALAHFYVATAMRIAAAEAAAGGAAESDGWAAQLDEALRLDPERAADWISLLAEIIPHHPAVAVLLPRLARWRPDQALLTAQEESG